MIYQSVFVLLFHELCLKIVGKVPEGIDLIRCLINKSTINTSKQPKTQIAASRLLIFYKFEFFPMNDCQQMYFYVLCIVFLYSISVHLNDLNIIVSNVKLSGVRSYPHCVTE